MAQVVDAVHLKHAISIKPAYVADVLRLRFGMRYRKIKRVAYLANSDRSLVIRHEFAKCMLKLLADGHTIINVDETFLNVADLRYMKWRKRGETNSMRERTIDPLLKVFAGVSNFGSVYMAVSQVNTDSDTFCLFMQKLIAKLQTEDPNFRNKVVL